MEASSYFRSRLLASAIDYILVATATKAIILIGNNINLFDEGFQTNLTTLIVVLSPVFYYSCTEVSSLKATVGKKLAGLTVTTGSQTVLQAIWNTLVASFLFFIVLCFCMLLMGLVLSLAGLPIATSVLTAVALLISWVLVCVPVNTKAGYRTILDIASKKTTRPKASSKNAKVLWSVVIGGCASLISTYFAATSTEAKTFFCAFVFVYSFFYLLISLLNRYSTNEHFQKTNSHGDVVLLSRDTHESAEAINKPAKAPWFLP